MALFHNRRNTGMDSDTALAFSRQSTTTNPQTANQIAELGRVLNSGIKNVEVGGIQSDVFETIPKQHFSEMRRLAELTGAKVSMHAPIIDPAGFTQQGWSEDERVQSENYMKSVLDKAHELAPERNIPVNFHTTIGVPGTMTEKITKSTKNLTDEEKESGERITTMYAVERETGKIIPLRREEKQHLTGQVIHKPEELLYNINETNWDQEKLQLMSYQKAKEEIQNMSEKIFHSGVFFDLTTREKNLNEEEQRELARLNSQMELHQRQIQEYDKHLDSGLNTLYHKYEKYRDKSEEVNERVSKEIETAKALAMIPKQEHDNLIKLYGKIPENKFKEEYMKWQKQKSNISDAILSRLSELPAPKQFVTSEDFAKENSITTIANVAAYGYKKYGENAPLVTMENVFPNMVLSRGESLKGLIQDSRKAFVEKLVKDQNVSKDKAEKIATKIIGATWDVGHLHHLKKQGYEDEDFIKETKKVAPVVKHIHLTDNFGFTDSHLPLGMGDVPIKEHLKALEKADKNAIGVVEAGGFINQFKANPIPETLEYLNSPMYSYDAGPNWTEARDLYGSYLVGYGDILPEKHFDTFYGGGFSRLPKELGGQSQGNKSRFAGTPNQ